MNSRRTTERLFEWVISILCQYLPLIRLWHINLFTSDPALVLSLSYVWFLQYALLFHLAMSVLANSSLTTFHEGCYTSMPCPEERTQPPMIDIFQCVHKYFCAQDSIVTYLRQCCSCDSILTSHSSAICTTQHRLSVGGILAHITALLFNIVSWSNNSHVCCQNSIIILRGLTRRNYLVTFQWRGCPSVFWSLEYYWKGRQTVPATITPIHGHVENDVVAFSGNNGKWHSFSKAF